MEDALIKDLINFLQAAKKDVEDPRFEDDFCIDDYAGGNMDDAFYFGIDIGRREMAEEILAFIQKNTVDKKLVAD